MIMLIVASVNANFVHVCFFKLMFTFLLPNFFVSTCRLRKWKRSWNSYRRFVYWCLTQISMCSFWLLQFCRCKIWGICLKCESLSDFLPYEFAAFNSWYFLRPYGISSKLWITGWWRNAKSIRSFWMWIEPPYTNSIHQDILTVMLFVLYF